MKLQEKVRKILRIFFCVKMVLLTDLQCVEKKSGTVKIQKLLLKIFVSKMFWPVIFQ